MPAWTTNDDPPRTNIMGTSQAALAVLSCDTPCRPHGCIKCCGCILWRQPPPPLLLLEGDNKDDNGETAMPPPTPTPGPTGVVQKLWNTMADNLVVAPPPTTTTTTPNHNPQQQQQQRTLFLSGALLGGWTILGTTKKHRVTCCGKLSDA
jgi:hypothetical protein